MLKNNYQKISVFLARVSLGWLFLYDGITKVLNPEWTSAGYLAGAKTITGFYTWLASGSIIGTVDFLNKWGLTLIGISLILGVSVRLSAIFGAVLMLLYYFPILEFPYPNAHAYIVDDHIIYALVFIVLGAMRAGRVWGLDAYFKKYPWCKKFG